MTRFRSTIAFAALIGLAFASAVPVAAGAPPVGFAPHTLEAQASAPVPAIPLQPAHWGSWFDPVDAGEGMVIEVIDRGLGQNLLLVAYVYAFDGAGTPVWAFANQEVQPALVEEAGVVFYRFALAPMTPGGSPAPMLGELDLRPMPDGTIEARLCAFIGPMPVCPLARTWILQRLTAPPGLPPLVTCTPWGFSPPRPLHPYCREA